MSDLQEFLDAQMEYSDHMKELIQIVRDSNADREWEEQVTPQRRPTGVRASTGPLHGRTVAGQTASFPSLCALGLWERGKSTGGTSPRFWYATPESRV